MFFRDTWHHPYISSCFCGKRFYSPLTILFAYSYSYVLIYIRLVYLNSHVYTYIENTALQPPSSITQGATTTTSVSVSWSQVSGSTGYYVSYQRQDLGAPPVVTPQYERIVGGDNTSVTLSGLEAGTTYRIRVWSTDGTSVSRGTTNKDVSTLESSEFFVDVYSETHQRPLTTNN